MVSTDPWTCLPDPRCWREAPFSLALSAPFGPLRGLAAAGGVWVQQFEIRVQRHVLGEEAPRASRNEWSFAPETVTEAIVRLAWVWGESFESRWQTNEHVTPLCLAQGRPEWWIFQVTGTYSFKNPNCKSENIWCCFWNFLDVFPLMYRDIALGLHSWDSLNVPRLGPLRSVGLLFCPHKHLSPTPYRCWLAMLPHPQLPLEALFFNLYRAREPEAGTSQNTLINKAENSFDGSLNPTN